MSHNSQHNIEDSRSIPLGVPPDKTQNHQFFSPVDEPSADEAHLSPPEIVSVSELFVLNPRHKDFITGKSRHLNSSSHLTTSCAVLFMVPFVLAGIVTFGLAAKAWLTEIQLRLYGVSAQAEITDLSVSTDSESGDSYHASYRYIVRGQVRTGRQQVNKGFYNRVEQGMNVPIVYATIDPNTSRILASDAGTPFILFITIFTAFWNLFVWAILIGLFADARRIRRLERFGRVLKGQVVDCKGATDSDGDHTVTLRYAFSSPTGREILGKERQMRNDLNGARLPLPGTPLAVLYADDKCHKAL